VRGNSWRSSLAVSSRGQKSAQEQRNQPKTGCRPARNNKTTGFGKTDLQCEKRQCSGYTLDKKITNESFIAQDHQILQSIHESCPFCQLYIVASISTNNKRFDDEAIYSYEYPQAHLRSLPRQRWCSTGWPSEQWRSLEWL
jgi:hypothetical protein